MINAANESPTQIVKIRPTESLSICFIWTTAFFKSTNNPTGSWIAIAVSADGFDKICGFSSELATWPGRLPVLSVANLSVSIVVSIVPRIAVEKVEPNVLKNCTPEVTTPIWLSSKAFWAMVLNKGIVIPVPIPAITIKGICEDADINRVTFYNHYLDQYDLLHQIQKEVIDEISHYLNKYDKNQKEVPTEMTVKVLEYIKENAELFNLLLNSDSVIEFQQELINILGIQKLTTLSENSRLCKVDTEYIFTFYASGSLGIIRKWLKDGTKKSPEELAVLILRMAIEGHLSF